MNEQYEVLIVGCGPCGIGAALKLKDAGVKFAMIERSTPGGKVNIAPRVDNYPGFQKISGPNLAYALFERVLKANIEVRGEDAESLIKVDDYFYLKTDQDTYKTKAVLIASGTKEKKLGFHNEDTLLGKGISYCAMCDGHFFRGVPVAVIGGGNSALKEATHLSRLVSHLFVVHRRNEFRGSDANLAELKEKSNVTILTPYVPIEILEDERVVGLRIRNVANQEEKILQVNGVFPLIGQIPNTQFMRIPGVLDESGNIPVDRKMMTPVPGLFAGGDVLPRLLRQIYLAEHDGMVAARSIIEYLKGDQE